MANKKVIKNTCNNTKRYFFNLLKNYSVWNLVLFSWTQVWYSRRNWRKTYMRSMPLFLDFFLWLLPPSGTVCNCSNWSSKNPIVEEDYTHKPTWVSSDVHGLEVPALDDSECESACGWQVTEWKHDLTEVNTFLWRHKAKKHIIYFSLTVIFRTFWSWTAFNLLSIVQGPEILDNIFPKCEQYWQIAFETAQSVLCFFCFYFHHRQ